MVKQDNMKNIYLTFDDGIQSGTAEVVEILRKTKVRATFFLNAINTIYTSDKDLDMATALFKEIQTEHVAGNHGFSHAHGFYSSFYSKGLLIDNNGSRRQAGDDFDHNYHFFRCFSSSDCLSLKQYARLPGRNTWNMLLHNEKNKQAVLKRIIDSDSASATLDLSKRGYHLFGWDDEWKMDFTIAQESRVSVEKKILESKIDFTDYRQIFPPVDFASDKNLMKDRLKEPWTEVAKRVLSNPIRNIVLLLHDRAFRAPQGNNALSDLESLIKYLKFKEVNFKAVDEYPLEYAIIA